MSSMQIVSAWTRPRFSQVTASRQPVPGWSADAGGVTVNARIVHPTEEVEQSRDCANTRSAVALAARVTR